MNDAEARKLADAISEMAAFACITLQKRGDAGSARMMCHLLDRLVDGFEWGAAADRLRLRSLELRGDMAATEQRSAEAADLFAAALAHSEPGTPEHENNVGGLMAALVGLGEREAALGMLRQAARDWLETDGSDEDIGTLLSVAAFEIAGASTFEPVGDELRAIGRKLGIADADMALIDAKLLITIRDACKAYWRKKRSEP